MEGKNLEMTTDSDGQSEEPKTACNTVLQDFSSYTTLHGFHFLFTSRSTIRRLIWTVLIVCTTALFAFQFVKSWEKYQSKFSVHSKEIEKANSIVFPAVSICNQNMMKKSKIEGKDAQAYLDRMDVLALALKYNAGKIGNVSSAFDVEKAVLESGHNASDMIGACLWNERVECGPQNFTRFFSFQRGLCYTFNSGKEGHPLLNVTSSGKKQMLTLYLKAQPEEYYGPFSYFATGFKVFVHDQKEEIPDMENKAQDISPGFYTIMGIKRTKIDSLKSSHSELCGERKLTNFQTYSQDACRIECQTRAVIKACGCRLFSMPGGGEFSNSGYCNMKSTIDCALPIYGTFNPASQCVCPHRCKQVRYNADLSVVRPFSLSLWDVLYKNKTEIQFQEDKARKSIALISIFYKTTMTDVIREISPYDITELISDIGGNMGMFLGCSLLTLWEFVDLIFIVILSRWRKTEKRRDAPE